MSSWAKYALAPIVPLGALLGVLLGAACGTVTNETPDADMRPVACNGGTVDVLPNGNFDGTDPPWRSEPASPSLLCGLPRIMPDSGTFAGCLGGGGDGTTTALTLPIALPAGAISARLVGRICIATEETQPLDSDIVTFDILDGIVSVGMLGRRTNLQGAAACNFTSFTFDAPLTRDPATATFRVQSTLDVADTTSFYVDSLRLTVACR
ncbi:MAG TPA: hypothetical protein VNO30_13970 [Kofleriaceae bacterium]|nr:hypothetical protein [Kofleriaceae bacterium]